MKIDEETLMAFADGQLSGPQANAVAAAVAGDPVLAEKLAQHRQLRETMASAFAPVLDEPVPPPLRPLFRKARRTPLATWSISQRKGNRELSAVPPSSSAGGRSRQRWSWGFSRGSLSTCPAVAAIW